MSNLITLVNQGLLYPKRFFEGRLKKSDMTTESLKNGEGAVLSLEGKKVAVYKSDDGSLSKLSPACTHLG